MWLVSCLLRPQANLISSSSALKPQIYRCVTVVDAASFFDDLESIEELADR
jgi:hypothetical protein